MRLHRQSALLNDAIEVLNEHLRTAKGNVPEAWALLNQTEVDFIHEEISNCISSRVYYLQNYHAIAPERGPIQCLYPLLDHQWMVENAIAEERARYGKSQHIVLKPRQAGITEYAIGIMCHATFFTPHAYTMIVAQNPEVAAFDQRKVNLAWTELPWWLRPERLYHSKGEYLEFNRKGEIERMQDPGLGSVIVTTHAQRESGTAIGRCQTPDTMVWTDAGPLTLEEIYTEYTESGFPSSHDEVGAWYDIRRPLRVYSWEDGKTVMRPVTRVFKQHYKGPLQHVQIGSGITLHKTPEHAILSEGEWIKIPKSGRFATRLNTIPRAGSYSRTYPDEAELIGWQLSEGSENRNGIYITQKCDVMRKHIEDLARRVVNPPNLTNRIPPGVIGKSKNPRIGYIYFPAREYKQSLIARGYLWGKDCRTKRIPEFIYQADDESVRAFLRSFFEGEGSVAHVIDIGSMSRNLMEGLRLLLSRFGICLRFSTVWKRQKNRRHEWYVYYRGFIGGPSLIKFHEQIGFISDRKNARLAETARKAKGTNCEVNVQATKLLREACIASGTTCKYVMGSSKYSGAPPYKIDQYLTSDAAARALGKLRKLCDGPPRMYNNPSALHYAFRRFRPEIALRYIPLIEEAINSTLADEKIKSTTVMDYCGDLFDLEVPGTHNYSVSGIVTHNTVRNLHGTEVSRWESGSVYTGDIEPSMNAPDLLGIMESTARGNSGFFYEMCQEAMEHPDETDWRLVFLPAYRARKFSLPPKPGFALTAAEQAIKARVQQEENFTITDAFFNWRRRRIKSAVRRTGQPYEHYESYPLTPQEAFQSSSWCVFPRHKMDSQGEQNIITPRWQGEITFQGKGARPQVVLEEVKPGTPLPRRETTNRLWIWEQPDPHATYYQFGDTALGTGGDFSAAQIFRAGQGREPDVQVAEWMGWIPPTEFSKILYSLGFFYNTCETAIEYAKEGITAAEHFANGLSYPNIYRWRGRLDKIGGGLSNSLHWQTTHTTKKLMVTQMIEALLGDLVVIRSSALLDQMYKFVVKSVDDNDIPISMGGESGNDDLVMAAMGCLTCMHQVYPEFRAMLDEPGQGSAGHALSRGAKPSGGSLLYGLYDEFTRMRGQTRDLLVAQELAAKNNWVIRPIPVSRANTAYSVIHHGTGMEHELYRNYGMDSWDITPGVVSSYREHGRGAQAGSVHDTGYHDTGDMDALAAGDSWGGQG